MKVVKKCFNGWDLQANDTRRRRNESATKIQSIVRRYLAIRKVFLRLHVLHWERRTHAILVLQRWWRGEKARYSMWNMRVNVIAAGAFQIWKEYSDDINDDMSRSRKARRQYKKGDSFQYKQKTMESWPPENYE